MSKPIPTDGYALLLTNREDVSADLVVLEFQRRGLPYARFNTEDVPRTARVQLTPSGNADGLLLAKGGIGLRDVRSVWYRRPVAPRPAPSVASGADDFGLRESTALLENLWDALPGLWVSPRDAIRRATPRMTQLRAARQLGLRVPPTIMGNDVVALRAFAEAHGAIIAKPIDTGAVTADKLGPERLIFTTPLEPRDLEACLASVTHAPVLLQRLEPKRADIRVTVIGTRIFAAEIRTPGDARIDWRALDPADLVQLPHELPSDLSGRISELVHQFGLHFGALDLLWTPNGEYVFLEINPNGQWAWLELELGFPMASALVDLLTMGPS